MTRRPGRRDRGHGGEAVALAGDVRSEDYAKALVALASKHSEARHRLQQCRHAGRKAAPSTASRKPLGGGHRHHLTGTFLGASTRSRDAEQGSGSVIFTSTFVGYSFASPASLPMPPANRDLIGLTRPCGRVRAEGRRVNAILPAPSTRRCIAT